MKRAIALALSGAAVLALAGAALSTSGDPWKHLRRPLHIPRIDPGAQCPASGPDTSVDFASYGVGQGYGPGPAYPILGGNSPRAGLEFDYPRLVTASSGAASGEGRRCFGSCCPITAIGCWFAGGSSTAPTVSASTCAAARR